MLDLAAESGARIAVRAPEGVVTYAELAARTAAVRTRLSGRGVAAGDRVMLCCRTTVETIANAVALYQLRCTVLPVAGDATAGELQSRCETFVPVWQVFEGEVSRCGSGGGAPVDPGEPVLQALLSSGSSGRPKIVLRSAAQVEAGMRIFVTGVGVGPEDRVLALVPLEHSVGFNSVLLGTLSVGGAIVLPRSRHPRGIVQDIEDSDATVFPAAPLFFDWMSRFAAERPGFLGRVRVCVSVGDVLSRATHEAFAETFGISLWQSYGASEAGPVFLNRTGACPGDIMALGQPYPEVGVDLLDERGEAVPDGEVGEIVVRSPAVGSGYIGGHDGASRIAGGRFFTGDLACRRRGEVYFAGRAKVLINRAGRKIDPAEIERVLRGHSDVVDAAVRVAGSGESEPLQALVVTHRSVRPEELIELCARALQPFKVPRIIEFRDALPRDATGKLKRDLLATW